MKNIEVLQVKLECANENVDKLVKLIAKYEGRFAKRPADYDSLTEHEAFEKYGFETSFKFDDLREKIAENNKKLAKAQEKVEQVLKEIEATEKENKEIPQVLIDLMNKLIEYYDEIDSKDEEILERGIDYHERNCFACEAIIKDLMFRCKAKVGRITKQYDLYVQVGTHGFPVLNGVVEGEKGRARLESIVAGGYNIQRKHIRVLVKDC